jgi:hypothetical protein
MKLTKSRVLSAITAGSLTLAVVAAITVGSGSGHTAQPAAFAAQTESFPPVNLDDCPILHPGYPTGGCVAHLQKDLNSIAGTNILTVDGTFGSVNSQTYNAVIAFQGAHGLQQDGLVGPATKQALAAALSGTPGATTAPGTPGATTAPGTPGATTAPGTPGATTAPGTPGASPTSGTSGDSPVTTHCGYVTCSAYLSRSVTRAAYEKSIVGAGGYAALAILVCAPLHVPPLTPVGIACDATAAAQGPWIVQELSDAATQHGAMGACLKVTYAKVPPAITWWSTNNGQYCKD